MAGEASQRSRRLAVAQAVAAGVAEAVTVVEVLGATVDAVFDNSGYYAVTATLLDHEADEQLIVADRTRALRNHTGMRRPLAAGLVGEVGLTGVQQLHGQAGRHPGFEWPDADAVYNSLLLTPVIVDGRCDAVLELCDTRANAFDPHDAELMASVAGLLGSALMRAGALEESRHRAATARRRLCRGGRADRRAVAGRGAEERRFHRLRQLQLRPRGGHDRAGGHPGAAAGE